ncbi:sensor kinase [Caballeronia arationis]|uniref:sensor histidine kinase n=1 Tax=Caballeronia arationis TaxID=1777142 RepID=UPI00074B7BE9|nr:HAMP domain-containing sensor histidine kinase [Caballeronia arationis]SAL01446.1 sensor kinase [Caballeronia arationis]
MCKWLGAGSLRRRLCLWLLAALLAFGLSGAAGTFVMIRAAAIRAQAVQYGTDRVTNPAKTTSKQAGAARVPGIRDPDHVALFEIAPSVLGLLLLLLANLIIIGLCLRPLDRIQHFVAFNNLSSPDAPPLEHMPVELRPIVAVTGQLEKQLMALRDSQREFAHYAAHVLRTSVAAVCLQVANLGPVSVDQRQERLKELEEGARRLAATAAQLLELANARLEPPANLAEVALRPTVYNAVARALPLAIERDVDLGADSIEDVSVLAVEEDVQRLLFNVINYAVRQSATAARVDVKVSRTSELGVVEVTEDEPGVREAQSDRIFEPFQAADGRQDDSLGLGLPIAAALAERYGGRLVIKRHFAGASGATVRIELPGLHRQTPAKAI